MDLTEIIKDSLRYAAAGWYNVLFLGIIFCLADYLINLNIGLSYGWLDLILVMVALFLVFIEAGYTFRILEETVVGSRKPPKMNKISSLLSHGFKETMLIIIYFFLPFILLLLPLVVASSYFEMGLRGLNDFSGWNIGELTTMVFMATTFMVISVLSIIFQGVLLNMAHCHGSFPSAFKFSQIWAILKKIGIRKLLSVYFLTVVTLTFIQKIIFDSLHLLPLGDILATLVVAPYLLMVTTRMLGLIDR